MNSTNKDIDLYIENNLYKYLPSIFDASNHQIKTSETIAVHEIKEIKSQILEKKDDMIQNIESNINHSLINHLLISVSKVYFKNIRLNSALTDNYGIIKELHS